MENLERILAEHPFFEGIDRGYVQLVAGCAANVCFDAGQRIFCTGDEAEQFFSSGTAE